MMKRLVAKIDQVNNVIELCKEINVLDIVHWINKSWAETCVETISKCYNLCGFPVSSDDNSTESDSDDDKIPLNQLAKINSVAQIDPETLATFDQHVSIEDDSNDWKQALIETHSATAKTAIVDASDSDDDQTYELSGATTSISGTSGNWTL